MSKTTGVNVPFLRMPFPVSTSVQSQRPSASASSNMQGVVENSERNSHNSIVNDAQSVDASVSVTESSSGRHCQPRESSCSSPTTPTSPEPVRGPSVISRQGLPTYRQVSMTEEGVIHSGLPITSPESSPYHIESSLPDILYSHMIPRLPPGRLSHHRPQRSHSRPEEAASRGNRHRHRHHGDRSGRHRRHSSSWTHPSSSSQVQEGTCKEPCVKCVVTITSFRWVLVVLSILGVCCVVTGIVLAALHAAGQSFLFLAIMFIGLGVLLVIVVGVGWKCTPRGHEPLHALFGIGRFMNGRSRGRRRRHRNRDRHWFGGVLYPEFQFRRPPPSYAASMQEYQNQSIPGLDESPGHASSVQNNSGSPPRSPPPSYRSRTSTAHSGILNAFPNIRDGDEPSSRPPTYRSRAPSRRPSFPHYDVDLGVYETEVGVAPVTDVSVTESSCAQISPSDAHTGRNVSQSVSAALSHFPTAESSVLDPGLGSLPASKPSTSLTVISVGQPPTIERNIETDNQNSIAISDNTQNLISGVSTSALTAHQQENSALDGHIHASSRPPSLHQRMASEDRHILEQTLQSLEEHMNDSVGIVNEGVSFDEQDQTNDSANLPA